MNAVPIKVLVIDDEPPIRKLLRMGLSTQGYEILEASNGKIALELLAQDPALIILDLGLPVGDGFVVLERLQNSDVLSGIPVIVLSARDPQMNEERALKAGAAAFFQKPADNDELMNVIRANVGPRQEFKQAWPS